MSPRYLPVSEWPAVGKAVLELGVTLSTYIGLPPLLGSVIWILVHRIVKGTPALRDPKTWIFSLISLAVVLMGHCLVSLSWRHWGRSRDHA